MPRLPDGALKTPGVKTCEDSPGRDAAQAEIVKTRMYAQWALPTTTDEVIAHLSHL